MRAVATGAREVRKAAIGVVDAKDRARHRGTSIRVSTRSVFWSTAVVAPRPVYRNRLQIDSERPPGDRL